ncbi:MAG: metallophosphoesterase family protein [Thermomicrobiales bacterium]
MSARLRVAVVTDIHGNLEALEAVLADIERRGPFDRLVAGGDYCLNGPDPARALDLIVDRADIMLNGNTDRDLVDEGVNDPELGEKKRASIQWTRDALGSGRLAMLAQLPHSDLVETPGEPLLVVHANPHDLDQHIFPDMTVDAVRTLVAPFHAGVLVFGHLHIPYRRRIGKLRLFDVASCGLSRDGDRRAAWGSFVWSPDNGWRGAIHRVAYDHGTTVLRMLDSGMPHPDRRIRDLLRATYD